jgi:hypothetical protein
VHRRLVLTLTGLRWLKDLPGPPTSLDETASLKEVRQSRKHVLLRWSHPYEPGVAVRLICWFPPGARTVVVALLAADKAVIGDLFYDSVGNRADQLIDQWLREQNQEEGEQT